jgi:hypothetical protein
MPNQRKREKGWWPGLDLIRYQQWRPCFIATAAYGTDTAREIDILREFRDVILLPNGLGARFVSFYYRASPPMADFISQHDVLRAMVREGFVAPMVTILGSSRNLWTN